MRRPLLAALITVAVAAAACGPSEPERAVRADDAITVASFDFDESEVVADLYAEALRAAGYEVRHVRRVGSREIVLPSLERGLIEVVPEYSGSAVEFLGGRASADPQATHETLVSLLEPRGVRALPAAGAQSRNGLVVTAATAAELALHDMSDLREVAAELVLGGPPECPDRDLCLPGFRSTYGLEFGSFLPLDSGGPVTAHAVEGGTVDVGVLFTSDGGLAADDLVLLRDDLGLQPAENVTPLVRADTAARFGSEMLDVLESVSAELTTSELRALNATVRDGAAPLEAARRWLAGRGLGDASG